jgi:hypothetical protein
MTVQAGLAFGGNLRLSNGQRTEQEEAEKSGKSHEYLQQATAISCDIRPIFVTIRQ